MSSTVVRVARFAGDFEVHLTLRTSDPTAAQQFAVMHGVKFTHIVLGRGRQPDQPMLTLRASGDLAAVQAKGAELVAAAAAAGLTVVRSKIEASPHAEGVPGSDAAAATLGPDYYFEHHIKLLLAPDDPSPATIAERHAAHLSRNARRVRTDGCREQFVTQRCRGVGAATAGSRLAALVDALARYRVLGVEREFVVFDSAVALDDGWIREEAG